MYYIMKNLEAWKALIRLGARISTILDSTLHEKSFSGMRDCTT